MSLNNPTAAVGVPYSYNFSTAFFNDGVNGSPPTAISLTYTTPASNIGITFYPGLQGLAQLLGSAFQYPVSATVTYVVSGSDEAGNTATRTLVLAIAPPILNLVVGFASTPLTFTEKGSALFIDAAASFAWTANVDALSVTLVGCVTDAGGYLERLTALTPTGMVLTAWAYDVPSVSGTLAWACVSPSCLGPVGVTAWLQSLAYTNAFVNFPAGGRRVQVRC